MMMVQVSVSEEFLEHCSEGALSVEVYGHRSSGAAFAWQVGATIYNINSDRLRTIHNRDSDRLLIIDLTSIRIGKDSDSLLIDTKSIQT